MTENDWSGQFGLQSFGTEGTTDSNWSLGHVPTSTENAVVSSGIDDLTLGAESNEDVGSIAVGFFASLLINSGAFFTAENGTGPDTNIGGISVSDGDLIIGNTASPSTFDDVGSIMLNGTGASTSAKLLIAGTINLTGSGSIEMTIGDPVADNVISGAVLGGAPTVTNQTEDISGTGTISDLNFTNNATVETNNTTTTSGSGGILQIEGSGAGGSFVNDGLVQADNGGTLILGENGTASTIVNNKAVELDSTGSATSLEVAGNLTVSGTGSEVNNAIILTGATNADAVNHDRVVSDGSPATLTLVNETLKGAGRVGDANLTLDNQSGIIDADDPGQTLALSTGNNTVINGAAASLQADGGELGLVSPVDNAGTIVALNGGTVSVLAPISGSGAVDIGQNGTLSTDTTIAGNVTFTGSDAELDLDNAEANGGIGGTIVGGVAGDSIDFEDVPFSTSLEAVWNQTSASGGTLSLVSGGSTLASVNLTGQYPDLFYVQDDSGSTFVDIPNPSPPAATSEYMFMVDSGDYEIYDIGQNAILGACQLDQLPATLQTQDTFVIHGGTAVESLLRDSVTGDFYQNFESLNNAAWTDIGNVGLSWQVLGFGNFSSNAGETDMLMQNSADGDLELYDLGGNGFGFSGSASLGSVGPGWVVAGFDDFSGNAGESDMLMRNDNTGAFEIYDISNSQLTGFASMGQVGLAWSVVGFGDFSGNANESDMLMRDSTTGAFEIYDISNNRITYAASMGQVGLAWSVVGFGDFSGNANESDMLMRNANTGAFEVYDITNNQLTYAAPIGQVGLEWQVVGFAAFAGIAGEDDMLMRDTGTGEFLVLDIANNHLTNGAFMGQVGTEWSVAGIVPEPSSSSMAANAQLAQSMAAYAPGSSVIGETAPPPDQTTAQNAMASVAAGSHPTA